MDVIVGFNNSSGVLDEWNQIRDRNMTGDDIIDNKVVQALFFIIYTTIFVLGIFGNVLVCYVVFRNKAMQTVTNLFITNLALSDILLCILAVPFTPLYTFLGRWVFGKMICHLVSYAQGASVYISTLTLTSIAIDRFFVIIYPFHPRMKLSTCIVIIVNIWLFSILVTLPYGVYMRHKKVDNNSNPKYFCEEDWPKEDYRKIFGGLTTMMQFVIPFFMMAFCYICVSLRLNDRARSKPGSKSSKKEEADRERKRRTNRMLIAMVVIFLLSWLPLNTINIINDFYVQTGDWQYYFLSFFMVHSMAMSSTCYNPFLYAWLNENFRKEFKQVLPCFDPSGSRALPNNRLGNWRSERTCNGNNETQQDSLLHSGIHRAASIRSQKSIPMPPAKTDSVEVENVLIPATCAVYDSAAETVRLKFINEEDPPSYLTAIKADENCGKSQTSLITRMSRRKNVTLVAVGDKESKKSDLLLKYTTDRRLSESFKPSIFVNNIQNVVVDRRPYSVHFIDAESDDVYKSLRLNDYKKAHCFLLCYSISNRESFKNIRKKWCIEIRKCSPSAPVVLIGTESECRGLGDVVSKEEGENLGILIKADGFVECSIRDYLKVDDVFITAIRSINRSAK